VCFVELLKESAVARLDHVRRKSLQKEFTLGLTCLTEVARELNVAKIVI
jgi:hypothetical protein